MNALAVSDFSCPSIRHSQFVKLNLYLFPKWQINVSVSLSVCLSVCPHSFFFRYIRSLQKIFIRLLRLLQAPNTLQHTIPPDNIFSHILQTPHRNILPYHQHTISHTYRDFSVKCIKPYRHTIPTYGITCRATPHTTPRRTVPHHTHTVPTGAQPCED